MFTLQHTYRGPLGSICFSEAFDRAVFRNTTPGIALKYVSRGQENYRIRESHIPVSGGQFILLPERQDYEAGSGKNRIGNLGICIDLDPDPLWKEVFDPSTPDLLFGLPFTCSHSSPLGRSLKQLAEKPADPSGGEETLLHIKEAVGLFGKWIGEIQPRLESQAIRNSTRRDLLSRLMFARDYIHHHYRSPIRLQNLARETGISAYHFSRLFRACFQKSPQQLQTELRMKEALKWLAVEEVSFSEIAYRLGYSDLAAFSNQFKKHFGEPPSEMRKAGLSGRDSLRFSGKN